jgi:hypothetical protein
MCNKISVVPSYTGTSPKPEGYEIESDLQENIHARPNP